MPEVVENDVRAMIGRPECEEKEYIPQKREMLQRHEINIKFLSVGCVISVGCKSIPFTSIQEGMEELNKYVKDPYQSSKRWDGIFNTNE